MFVIAMFGLINVIQISTYYIPSTNYYFENIENSREVLTHYHGKDLKIYCAIERGWYAYQYVFDEWEVLPINCLEEESAIIIDDKWENKNMYKGKEYYNLKFGDRESNVLIQGKDLYDYFNTEEIKINYIK